MYTERHVVTVLLCSKGRILLLKRSTQVFSYRGKWSGISGPVREDPLAQVFREIHDEVSLLPADVTLIRRAAPIEFVEEGRRMRWRVHPFLVRADDATAIQIGWEHETYRWIDPRQVHQYDAVPMLSEALERVWDVGELGPQVGIIRSQETQMVGGAWPETPPAPADGLVVESLEDQADFDTAEALPEDADPGPSPPAAPPDPQATRSERGLRVKVMRNVTTTGEFPHPGHLERGLAPEPLPPCFTGRELLQDPQVAPLLDALADAPHQNPHALLELALQILHIAARRSAAPTEATWLEDLKRVTIAIGRIRPSHALLPHCCALLLSELADQLEAGEPRPALQTRLSSRIQTVLEEERAATGRLAEQTSRLISPGATLMTVGYSLALLDALQRTQHFGVRVIVSEGRPNYSGRLMARAVLTQGRSATLITDAAIGLHLVEIDLVVVDAVALLGDGSAVARVGAYPLALAARARKCPLYVVATLQHLDLRPSARDELVLEEKEPSEVWSERLPGLDVRNVTFEVIPRELITGIVAEDGLIDPANLTWELRSRDELLNAITLQPGRPPSRSPLH